MNKQNFINIGNHVISNERKFIIAEIGNNHNGSFDAAIDLIDKAYDAGADCVKFQLRHIDEVYRSRSIDKSGEDLGTEYVIDLLKRFELPASDHQKLFDYSVSKGITYLCTPWDYLSVNALEDIGVLAYKVASADLTNLPLIKYLANTGKPLILSTGMSTLDEISKTVSYLQSLSAEFILLHCNSTYPAPVADINLKFLDTLKTMHSFIGYSGHERGINVSLAASAMEICLVERHFTTDRLLEGPDHSASLVPSEFTKLVDGIREIEQAMGDGIKQISQGEMINRENLSKSLVAANSISSGHIITANDIDVRSPGQGLSPQFLDDLIGIEIGRNLNKEDFFFKSDISKSFVESREYSFSRPWGIPVRHHDFNIFNQLISPDLFEFHLSYSDLELDLKDFFKGEYANNFVIHAPELFENSHLLDLASSDNSYRAESIKHMQRVIDLTREFKFFFPKTEKPLIVTNIGGFSMDENFSPSKVTDSYKIFKKSLAQLDLQGVELIPQTMAPFPWHFGGQRFQNLFVHPREIEEQIQELNLRVCFDVSHSMLTCNHFGYDFYEFCSTVAPYSAHIHIGDASGTNGEGLQIGQGEIDFKRMSDILNSGCASASFIPEIWQGHKNRGEGFWIALQELETYL
jgi:sialic acid synthase SpsE/sugar phosphate isomerase/epimerase